jgi:ferric-dicitrate binding protein FerR (iron transport regulator)
MRYLLWLILLVAALMTPQAARADYDWSERIVALATDVRNQAVQAVQRAEKRMNTAESDLSAAQSAGVAAQRSNHTEAASIAREAEAVAQDELRLARELLKKATAFLAEREQVLTSVRKAAQSKDPTARGVLVPEKGSVHRFAADGSPITDLSQPLRPGERIKTDAGGQARLFMAKGDGEVELQASSTLLIQQDDENGFMAGLENGLGHFFAHIKNEVRAKANKFEVRTPTAVLAVRGTDFIVKTSGPETIVQVLSGHVFVTTSKGKTSLTLEPGESATVTPESITKTVSSPGDATGTEKRGADVPSH